MGQADLLSRQRDVGTGRYAYLFAWLINAAEHGRLPDALVRWGIRRILMARHDRLSNVDDGTAVDDFLQATRSAPIAVTPEKANQQHYELPAEFFRHVLGERLKYSCCYWPEGIETLNDAEERALAITCQRAELHDGHNILELGCGWGSLSLWMAERYPSSTITAVSNSTSQRQFIEQQAALLGLSNLKVITADINYFETEQRYDRIVSVEMFEHVRNHTALMQRIHGWLVPRGRLFVHVFCHRTRPYLFHTEGELNWMGRYFFTGGMMPSTNLLPRCAAPLDQVSHWKWSGNHYAKTCRAWLRNQDAASSTCKDLMRHTYGHTHATRWYNRWRMFFMACEELFAFDQGDEWLVSHYLFERQSSQ
ncbi:MAG: SAM-dependent methyltransferase [Bythopirellula sp.]